jgi:hypothetical protein
VGASCDHAAVDAKVKAKVIDMRLIAALRPMNCSLDQPTGVGYLSIGLSTVARLQSG